MSGHDAAAILAETIGWWRSSRPTRHQELIDAATEALLSGLDSNALAELAGAPAAENPFVIDDLVQRIVRELDLAIDLESDSSELAARRMARLLIRGDITERGLSAWAHRFGHTSEVDAVNELASLGDTLDLIGEDNPEADAIVGEIRRVAQQLLGGRGRIDRNG